MSSKEEKAKAYIKPIILDRNKNLNDNNWELGSDYLDFTGYEVQCAFEAGWDAAIENQDKSFKWIKNSVNNKPQLRHSVLMKTTLGIAEGEWQGDYWLQYRWSCRVKDKNVLYWIELNLLDSDLPKEE